MGIIPNGNLHNVENFQRNANFYFLAGRTCDPHPQSRIVARWQQPYIYIYILTVRQLDCRNVASNMSIGQWSVPVIIIVACRTSDVFVSPTFLGSGKAGSLKLLKLIWLCGSQFINMRDPTLPFLAEQLLLDLFLENYTRCCNHNYVQPFWLF